MHPAVRLLCLLAVAAALPTVSLPALALLCAVSLLVYVRVAASALPRLRGGLFRLRWLLLAIFVLYGGCTPGEPLLQTLPGFSREGLTEGARRALVLVDLLILVYLLLALTAIAELVAALQLLLSPLRAVGVDPARVALRLGLALEGVGEMQGRLKGYARGDGSAWERAARLIEDIEARAASAAPAPVQLASPAPPRWWEWLLPAVLLLVLQRWTP